MVATGQGERATPGWRRASGVTDALGSGRDLHKEHAIHSPIRRLPGFARSDRDRQRPCRGMICTLDVNPAPRSQSPVHGTICLYDRHVDLDQETSAGTVREEETPDLSAVAEGASSRREQCPAGANRKGERPGQRTTGLSGGHRWPPHTWTAQPNGPMQPVNAHYPPNHRDARRRWTAGSAPPYLVRRDDGHEVIVFPGGDASVEHSESHENI